MDTTLNQAADSQPSPRRYGVEFTGKAGEFFGIWLVNILLTIVTLGIYSAWAKVRTNRYFYSHTKINQHSFRYLAEPLQILKGRIIAFAVFMAYSVLSNFAPLVAVALALMLLVASPWLINQSLRFGLKMTSYRNIRFGFLGRYWDGVVHFILLPIVGTITLGLAYPWVLKRIDQYIYSNITYGGKQMKVNTSTSTYYLIVLLIIGLSIAMSIIVGIMMAVLAGALGIVGVDESSQVMAMVMVVLAMAGYFIFLSILQAVYVANIRNHIFANTELDDMARFESKVPPVGLGVLLFTNALAIVVTLGLAYPWAKIRKAAYLAEYTAIEVNGDMDTLFDALSQDSSVFAEEAAEVFDMDIALT